MNQKVEINENIREKHNDTVFENYRKSLIQHCKQSEQHLQFERTKII